MSKNYKIMLKMKKWYNRDRFLIMCQGALDKGKITQEEYNELVKE